MNTRILTALMMIVPAVVLASQPDNFYRLMEKVHAYGDGLPELTGSSLTGAYAINTNGYEYVEGQTYDPNNGPYEFWSMNFGATQSLRKFTLGVDGSDWYDHFDGFSWTSFWDGYGDYADTDVSGAGLDNLVGTSIIYATESDLGRVASGDPDFSTGICSTLYSGTLRTGSFVLNPAALTFNGVTYQPGELALVTSSSGSSNPSYRKVVLLYDLRQIGEYTDRQPDYDTGQDGKGNQNSLYGAYNQTDWNDCFYPLVTGQMILDTIDDLSTASTFNYGRQAVWAPDGSAIYFAGFTVNSSYDEDEPNDMKYYNGIWKYDLVSDELQWLHREPDRENRMFYCEMAAIDTELRDFTAGQESGLQILFASETHNVGGISCIVDSFDSYDPNTYDPNNLPSGLNVYDSNNFSDPALYAVVEANDLADVCEKAPRWSDIRNIVSDPSGNIYFYNTGVSDYVSEASSTLYMGSYAVFRYDTSDRLYAVSNRAHHMSFHYANGASVSGSSGAMGAFQYYPNLFGKEMLTYRSTPLKVPCGIELFEPLDFNRNHMVDVNDLQIFRDQRIQNDQWLDPIYSGDASDEDDPNDNTNEMPGIFDVDINYINCDISGNSMYRCTLMDDTTGQPVSQELLEDLDNLPEGSYSMEVDKRYFNEKAVTEADTKVLYQFVPAGDATLDGIVDTADLERLMLYFGTGNSTDDRKDYSQGDFDFDGDIDLDDMQHLIFAGVIDLDDLEDLILPCDTNLDGQVNLADFANLAGGFGTDGSLQDQPYYSQGDFDLDGDVDGDDLMKLCSCWLDGETESDPD